MQLNLFTGLTPGQNIINRIDKKIKESKGKEPKKFSINEHLREYNKGESN